MVILQRDPKYLTRDHQNIVEFLIQILKGQYVQIAPYDYDFVSKLDRADNFLKQLDKMYIHDLARAKNEDDLTAQFRKHMVQVEKENRQLKSKIKELETDIQKIGHSKKISEAITEVAKLITQDTT